MNETNKNNINQSPKYVIASNVKGKISFYFMAKPSHKWNNNCHNLQYIFRCYSSTWNEYRVHTYANTSNVCSIESFISGQSHIEYTRIAEWRTTWNQTEHIETNQNKTEKNRRTEQFQCRSTLECHQILLSVWKMYAQPHAHIICKQQTRNANVTLFQSGLCTICSCNTLHCIRWTWVCVYFFSLKLFIIEWNF